MTDRLQRTDPSLQPLGPVIENVANLPGGGQEPLPVPYRSQELYQQILESSEDCIMVLDLAGRLLYMSPGGQVLLGIADIAPFLHKSWVDFWPEADQPVVIDAIRRAGTGEICTFQGFCSTLSGQPKQWDNKISPIRGASGGIERLLCISRDVTEHRQIEDERNRAAETLRRAAELNAFRVSLANALRPLADPVEIQAVASRLLGEYLGANRVAYFELRGAHYVVERDYACGVPTVVGRHPIESFGQRLLEIHRAGLSVVAPDVATDPNLSLTQRAAYAAIQIGAHIGVPLVKGSELVAGLAVHAAAPRAWRADEVALAEEVAESTWAAVERARAEAALRQSEEKYRSLFESMDEGFCILQIVFDDAQNPVDARYLETNPAFERQTGIKNALGRTVRQLIPNIEPFWFDTYGKVALTGEPVRFVDHAQSMGRWFDVNAFRVGEPHEHRVAVLFSDISDRKRIEQDRERFLSVGSDFLVITAMNGHFLWVSPSFERLLGWTRAEMTAHPWTEFVHPDDVHASLAEADSLFAGSGPTTFENRYRHKDGSYRWLLWNSQPYPEERLLYAAAMDITERKQAEAERELLLASERHYANQLQGLTSAALSINSALSVDQVVQVITDQAAAIIGSHQAVTSMTIDRNWAQSINAIYLSDKYAPWRTYDAQPDGSGIYACVCHLNRSMRLTQAELEAHPHWQGFGAAAATHPPMRGWLAAPLIGRDGQNMGLIQLSDKHEGEFTEADESILVQLAQMASVAIENARLYEAEQQARAAAEAAREEAQAANRVKDEFLAVLSHELRSPLNPILGWSTLLQTHTLDAAKTAQALATIERNARLQSELIEDLLDVSRILRGKLSLSVAPVNLSSIVRAAMETVRLAAEAKSIALEANLEAVGSVSGDSTRLQQVVWNLLSNAVKFTPAGGRVTVCLERVESQPNQGGSLGVGEVSSSSGKGNSCLPMSASPPCESVASPLGPGPQAAGLAAASRAYAQITVADTGQGIAPEFLPHVFDYFRQADAATTRKFGGLGLGLAIVHHLVELHGGTVEAESSGAGQGATFVVKIPLIPAASPASAGAAASERPLGLQGASVLIVDDEADSREFAAFLLAQQGAQVTAAASASEALRLLARSKPDVLLSDIGMPDVDGYMLIEQIRALPPEQGGQVPAIALTAYAGELNQQQALAAGFQKHIAKPIEPQALVRAVSSLLT